MSNPYEDEDAINPSIDMNMNMNMSSTNDDNAPPFFKVFKQVGDSLRNGGFCNTPKQPSSIMRKGKKASIAVTSEADEVEVAVETDSDGEYSQAQEKIKSVTFHDLGTYLVYTHSVYLFICGIDFFPSEHIIISYHIYLPLSSSFSSPLFV